jgi:hypothetical protein
MPSPRARIGIVLAVLAAITVSMIGCSRRYSFSVEGIVRNAADGRPLRGVNIRLEGPFELRRSVTSDEGGSFSRGFLVYGGVFPPSSPWSLTLSADGFLDEEIDIAPQGEPCAGDAINSTIVRVYLRPDPSTDRGTE